MELLQRPVALDPALVEVVYSEPVGSCSEERMQVACRVLPCLRIRFYKLIFPEVYARSLVGLHVDRIPEGLDAFRGFWKLVWRDFVGFWTVRI